MFLNKTRLIVLILGFKKKKNKDITMAVFLLGMHDLKMLSHLQVGLSREGAVLDEADFILGEIQVSQVGEAVHGAEEHGFQLVLVQPQVVDCVVDVLGDGFVRRLVLAADGQPHVALVPLNEPAVSTGHAREVGKEHEGGNNN